MISTKMQNSPTFRKTRTGILEMLVKEKLLHNVWNEFLSRDKSDIIPDKSEKIKGVKRHKID